MGLVYRAFSLQVRGGLAGVDSVAMDGPLEETGASWRIEKFFSGNLSTWVGKKD